MRRDKDVFSKQELDEINSLYHSADNKLADTAEKRNNLKALVSKYPKSNRAGWPCCILAR